MTGFKDHLPDQQPSEAKTPLLVVGEVNITLPKGSLILRYAD
jgi:hypothetical protein